MKLRLDLTEIKAYLNLLPHWRADDDLSWDGASHILRDRFRIAALHHDEEEQRLLSDIHTFLKWLRSRWCSCGEAKSRQAVRCRLCARAHRNRQRLEQRNPLYKLDDRSRKYWLFGGRQ